jgi:hypothetical protein
VDQWNRSANITVTHKNSNTSNNDDNDKEEEEPLLDMESFSAEVVSEVVFQGVHCFPRPTGIALTLFQENKQSVSDFFFNKQRNIFLSHFLLFSPFYLFINTGNDLRESLPKGKDRSGGSQSEESSDCFQFLLQSSEKTSRH